MRETAIAEFDAHRSDLERLAYRMLGVWADVDDVMQEAVLRWTKAERDNVVSPRGYLRSIVTRLCIDRREEIERRKETYVGPWLPEPDVVRGNPDRRAEVAESVSFALMHVLETLTPVERAAYLLRRVFDYDYREIADILGKTEENCRKVVSRAEDHVLAGRPRFDAAPEDHQRICDRFLSACATGDMDGLLKLLADDVVMYSDGGGKVTAARRPIEGADRVARFFVGLFRKAAHGLAPAGVRLEPASVNGRHGYVMLEGEEPTAVWFLEAEGPVIRRCYIVRNPEKLSRVD